MVAVLSPRLPRRQKCKMSHEFPDNKEYRAKIRSVLEVRDEGLRRQPQRARHRRRRPRCHLRRRLDDPRHLPAERLAALHVTRPTRWSSAPQPSPTRPTASWPSGKNWRSPRLGPARFRARGSSPSRQVTLATKNAPVRRERLQPPPTPPTHPSGPTSGPAPEGIRRGPAASPAAADSK